MIHSDIIIVGAGAAGLMAARDLSITGRSVRILEARDYIGGRIHTLHNNSFSIPIETGAEFIHGEAPVTQSLLREAGISHHAIQGKTWHIENDTLQEKSFFEEGWDDLMKALKQLDSDMNMAEFLETNFDNQKHKKLKESARRFVEGYDAADIKQVSAFAMRDEWIHSNEDAQFRPEGGYSRLINFLVEECRNHRVTVHLSATVKEIRWQPGRVEVITKGKTFYTEKVIVTVPVSVLQAQSIQFTPPIKAHIDAAGDFGFGGVIKFLLEFDSPFWEQHNSTPGRKLPSLRFLFSDAFIPTWWSQLPTRSPLLTGWLAGPKASQLKKDDDALLLDAIHSLAYLFSIPEQQLSRQLRAWKVSNWINDPLFSGRLCLRLTSNFNCKGET